VSDLAVVDAAASAAGGRIDMETLEGLSSDVASHPDHLLQPQLQHAIDLHAGNQRRAAATKVGVCMGLPAMTQDPSTRQRAAAAAAA